jgi:uncharacterized protein YndB with AHSA1/START domain
VPQNPVYKTLATKDGLAEFWTRQVEGDSAVGGKLNFFFGSPKPAAVMEVAELSPDDRVQWRCVEGPPEWVGTTITFDLTESGGETVLLFTHADWREPVEFMHHCSTKWGTFLMSLKALLETGQAAPFPNDVKIDKLEAAA